jgi:hypothetical protein
MSGFIGENESFSFAGSTNKAGQSFIPVNIWSAIPDVPSVVIDGFTVFNYSMGISSGPESDRCTSNTFSLSDFPMNPGLPVVGGIANNIEAVQMPSGMSWEVFATFGRFEPLYGFIPPRLTNVRFPTDGNFWFGLTRASTGDIRQWDHCVNVYAGTVTRPIRGFVHSPNSVLIFEKDDSIQLPPRPVAWKTGIWQNNNQRVRIQCVNKVIRYFIDDTLIYTSRVAFDYNEPVYLAVLFDCEGQSMSSPTIVTGANVFVANPIALGPSTGADCAGPFPSPGGVPLPVNVTAIQGAVTQMPALPQGPTDPIPVRFQEVAVNWGEFEQRFATGAGDVNTLQKTPIRRFEIEWDGLSPEQAGILDAHYERSHAGLSFTMTYRGEVLTNCRYMSYSRTDHTRYWVQSRQASIVRYP